MPVSLKLNKYKPSRHCDTHDNHTLKLFLNTKVQELVLKLAKAIFLGGHE